MNEWWGSIHQAVDFYQSQPPKTGNPPDQDHGAYRALSREHAVRKYASDLMTHRPGIWTKEEIDASWHSCKGLLALRPEEEYSLRPVFVSLFVNARVYAESSRHRYLLQKVAETNWSNVDTGIMEELAKKLHW